MLGALLSIFAASAPNWDEQRRLPLLTFDDPIDRVFVTGEITDGRLRVDGSATVRLGALWPGAGWSAVLLRADGAAAYALLAGGETLSTGRSLGPALVVLPVPDGATPDAVRIDGTAAIDELEVARTDHAWPLKTWRVWRDGLTLHADGGAAAGGGWSGGPMLPVAEVGELRLVAGPVTLYRDGRLVAGPVPAAATLDVTGGRIDRAAPTDRDGDGHDEARDSYRVRADGPRLTVTLTPRATMPPRPVLEIAGLPAGEVVVTAAGALAREVERLADGRVLAVLPVGGGTRPVEVRVAVR